MSPLLLSGNAQAQVLRDGRRKMSGQVEKISLL